MNESCNGRRLESSVKVEGMRVELLGFQRSVVGESSKR